MHDDKRDEKSGVSVSVMREYANEWISLYTGQRKRNSELVRDTLKKMTAPLFDLNTYNSLVDRSQTTKETRDSAKKMARGLYKTLNLSENERTLLAECRAEVTRKLAKKRPFRLGKAVGPEVKGEKEKS